MKPGFRRRDADGSHERFERNSASRTIGGGRHAGRVIGPDVQRRVGELVGEKTEARDIRRPAPAGGRQVQNRDLEGVTRFGPVDVDGAGDRIDLAEVERIQLIEGRVRRKLRA